MLEEVLNSIHNFFIVKDGVHHGEFNISSGTISLDFLQNGQYFRIVGSVFNDGVYQYPAGELHDEEFSGEIWAMAVPPAVIALSKEISDWQKAYHDVINSPYQSESFGGYTYSKASSGNGGGSLNWQSVFSDKLNPWRKIS